MFWGKKGIKIPVVPGHSKKETQETGVTVAPVPTEIQAGGSRI